MKLEIEKVVHKSESSCKLTCGRGVHMARKIFEETDPAILSIKVSFSSVSAGTGLFLVQYYNI